MSNRKRAVFVVILVFLAAYTSMVFVPAVLDHHMIGFSGRMIDGQYQVESVLDGSPAEQAGLEQNDRISHIDRLKSSDLHGLYKQDFSQYLEKISDWRNRGVPYSIQRQGENLDLVITPRRITLLEASRFFSVRILFCLFLLTLTAVILLSGTRSREVKVFVACFLFIVIWLLFEVRYWPEFGKPLIPDIGGGLFKWRIAVSIIAVQLVIGCMLLISLQFPSKRQILEKYPRTDVVAVLAPLLILVGIAVVTGDTFFSMVQSAYVVRLWLNLIVLILALLLFTDNYRSCDSAVQREQSRWMIISFAVTVASIVGLWKIPRLISGSPLIPDYDWLLIPLALIPLSMTIAINNHRLFGIRGILSYRQKIIEARLKREKNHVRLRDEKIRSLKEELVNLQSDLSEFTVMESLGKLIKEDTSARMAGLEDRLPQLREIRAKKLLGNSPVWTAVFEDIALATYGTTPVLICGESGTGKTDVAKAIHELGDRKNSVYREISCAQFEHADPAFALGKLFGIGTGHGLTNVPREGQPGLLEECDNSTLFLDDFDCLPGNVQNLLLYPLEGKSFEPGIGKGHPRQVSVKFILATNQEPEKLVASRKLRGDILARLGSRIDIPPLRERKEDINILISHFIRELSAELDYEIAGVSEKASSLLNADDYPDGNVRQLKSELRHAIGKAMLEGDSVVRAGYLSDRYTKTVREHLIENRELPAPPTVGAEPDSFSHSGVDELEVLRANSFQIGPSEIELGYSRKSKTLSNHLRGLCMNALFENGWDTIRTARSVVGRDDPNLVKKIERKIRRYCVNIEKCIDDGNEAKLYNNLPAKYHRALTETIAKIRYDSN